MAEKEESSLIGYDPLAWMDDESGNAEKDLPLSKTEKDEVLSVESENDRIETAKTSNAEAEDSELVLESVQNIQNVSELHQKLIRLFNQGDKISIDASEVTSIDTATMQLLIILKQTAGKTQKEVVFDFPSEKFIEAAELLGLSEMLEVENAAAGFF